MSDERYLTFMGKGPRKIVHWEHFSCPDAESYLTGIDYYSHPRLCRLRMKELYRFLSPTVMSPKLDRNNKPINHMAGGETATAITGNRKRLQTASKASRIC